MILGFRLSLGATLFFYPRLIAMCASITLTEMLVKNCGVTSVDTSNKGHLVILGFRLSLGATLFFYPRLIAMCASITLTEMLVSKTVSVALLLFNAIYNQGICTSN